MIAWVFATPLDLQIANLQGIEAVSILTSNFLGTSPAALAITLVPGALIGIVGAYISSKKIAIPRKWRWLEELRQQREKDIRTEVR